MPRPVWSGTISFGLVSIPVKLFHAVSRKNVSFNQLDDRSMSRIRLKKVAADTGEDVPDEHIVKGYEVTKGEYVVVDPDELEPFIPSATKAIDLEEFVDLADIDPVFYDTPYIVAPDKSAKPYVLLAKAMEEAGKVAVGTFVMRSKQYVAAVRPIDGRLMLSTMAFADEVVDPAGIDELDGIGDITVTKKELAMAEQLVESLAGDFEPERFRDSYREQVLELIEKKAAGETFETPEPAAAAPKVVDLMAALEASVKAAKEARGRHPAAVQAVPARRSKAAAQAEDDEDEAEARPAKKAARSRARKSA
jgi:DNA end-binding protein Ku